MDIKIRASSAPARVLLITVYLAFVTRLAISKYVQRNIFSMKSVWEVLGRNIWLAVW